MLFPKTLTPFVVASLAITSAAIGAVDIKEEAGKVRVSIDGQLFTEYVYEGAPHVYYHPVIGPGGARMTRDYPMAETEGEERDHPHHRSLWFSHGLVNGVDFWTEASSHGSKAPKHPIGKIVHDKIVEAKGGEKEGTLTTTQKWIGPDGDVPLTSKQTMRIHQTAANERVFDLDVTLTAGDKDVLLGDTKEGTMAIRINESMRLKRPKNQPAGGHILNSEGHKDGQVWGKKAAWVDYWGPVNGKTVGVAIFDHPKNPRHPTRWHARDYGLFAANPFCEVEMDKTQAKGAGDFNIRAGQSLILRYRFYLHEGDAIQAKVAERYKEYAGQ